VAVAAGTGVLPLPFRGGDPMPASSVSAAATPGPLASESATGGYMTASPTAPGSPPSSQGTPSVPKSQQAAPDRTPVPAPGYGSTGTGKDRNGDGRGNGEGSGSTWYRKAVEVCRDYRNGRIDGAHRRRLESMADGQQRIANFCDRILGGSGSGDGKNDGQGDGKSDGKSDGGSDGKSDPGNGSSGGTEDEGRGLTVDSPPVSFVPEPAATPVTSASPASVAPSPKPSGLTDQ
ncbi:hypothetical protein J0695_07315, partial [Streptomyces beijiangensis]|nr:hypothetical protein [Streptomyces beijiangensis]